MASLYEHVWDFVLLRLIAIMWWWSAWWKLVGKQIGKKAGDRGGLLAPSLSTLHVFECEQVEQLRVGGIIAFPSAILKFRHKGQPEMRILVTPLGLSSPRISLGQERWGIDRRLCPYTLLSVISNTPLECALGKNQTNSEMSPLKREETAVSQAVC